MMSLMLMCRAVCSSRKVDDEPSAHVWSCVLWCGMAGGLESIWECCEIFSWCINVECEMYELDSV